MRRAAGWGSATTSAASKQGPAATPAAVSSVAASSLVRVEAHVSTPGRTMSSRCSPQPARSASRSSDFHSGRPTTSARRSNWCSRTTCMTNHPSPARNESRMYGGGYGMRGCPSDA